MGYPDLKFPGPQSKNIQVARAFWRFRPVAARTPVPFVFQPQFRARRRAACRSWEFPAVRFAHFVPASLAALMLATFAQPAAAGMEEALKALQSNDPATAEKELDVLAKERDPRAEFLLGLYVYGSAD